MIRFTRILGYLFSGVGALALLFWMIRPLRAVWPFLLELPWPIRLGLGTLLLGFLLVMASLIAERVEERGSDRALRDR
jgi:hypothetical protein